MSSDLALATVLLDEVRAGRAENKGWYTDLDARVKVLERKSDMKSAVVSAVTSALIYLVPAIFSGCFHA